MMFSLFFQEKSNVSNFWPIPLMESHLPGLVAGQLPLRAVSTCSGCGLPRCRLLGQHLCLEFQKTKELGVKSRRLFGG